MKHPTAEKEAGKCEKVEKSEKDGEKYKMERKLKEEGENYFTSSDPRYDIGGACGERKCVLTVCKMLCEVMFVKLLLYPFACACSKLHQNFLSFSLLFPLSLSFLQIKFPFFSSNLNFSKLSFLS